MQRMNRGTSSAFLKGLMVCLILGGPSPGAAQAQWQLASESVKTDLGHGCWQVSRMAAGPAELDLSLVFFDMKQARAVLMAQTTRDRAKAKTPRRRSRR